MNVVKFRVLGFCHLFRHLCIYHSFGCSHCLGTFTVDRKYISCILLSKSCIRCLVAKGERVIDFVAGKTAGTCCSNLAFAVDW